MKAVLEEDRKKWGDLHNRLLTGDVIVSAEIAEYFLPILRERINIIFQNIDDPHLVETIVIDAVMDYITKPNQYIPSRGDLLSYLVLKSRSDLLNYLDQNKKDRSLLSLTEIVELGDDSSVYSVELVDNVDIESNIVEDLSPIWNQLMSIIPDKKDQEIVKLMLTGVRETEIYAEVIGIEKLSVDDKFRIVKQNKDRLKKIIQRHFPKEELKNE